MMHHHYHNLANTLAFAEHLSYVGFFLVVAFSGYAIPIPEEVVLLLAGYLAAQGLIHLPIVIVVCILGAICGDSLIFYLSGHGSRFTEKYHSKVEQTHVGWYMRHMKKSPGKTIFFSRFIVGMRFLNPLVSGLMKVPADVFVLSTALSAVLYIPFIIFLGYYFSNQIETLLHVAESVRHNIILGLIAGSLILIILFIKNLWKRPRGTHKRF
jgi:membrane protein DedA with SNARE-associated domain